MKETLELMNQFEERNNISTTIEIHSDGSGTLKEFWGEEKIKDFSNLILLNLFLSKGKLKLSEGGSSLHPIEISYE